MHSPDRPRWYNFGLCKDWDSIMDSGKHNARKLRLASNHHTHSRRSAGKRTRHSIIVLYSIKWKWRVKYWTCIKHLVVFGATSQRLRFVSTINKHFNPQKPQKPVENHDARKSIRSFSLCYFCSLSSFHSCDQFHPIQPPNSLSSKHNPQQLQTQRLPPRTRHRIPLLVSRICKANQFFRLLPTFRLQCILQNT